MDSSMDRILEASLALFCDRGFAATSMRDIAALAEVSPANIYSHFTNKEEIFSDLYEKHLIRNRSQGWPERLMDAWHSPDGVKKLTEIAYQLQVENPYYLQLLFIDLTEFKGKYRELLQEGMTEQEQAMGDRIQSDLPTGVSFTAFRQVVLFLFNSIGVYTLLSGMSLDEFLQSGISENLIKVLHYRCDVDARGPQVES